MKFLALLLMAAFSTVAAEKKPFAAEEMDTAFKLSVGLVQRQLPAPSTSRFGPISDARFSRSMGGFTDVRLWVDSQNHYGAMLRWNFLCHIKFIDNGERYRGGCVDANHPLGRRR